MTRVRSHDGTTRRDRVRYGNAVLAPRSSHHNTAEEQLFDRDRVADIVNGAV